MRWQFPVLGVNLPELDKAIKEELDKMGEGERLVVDEQLRKQAQLIAELKEENQELKEELDNKDQEIAECQVLDITMERDQLKQRVADLEESTGELIKRSLALIRAVETQQKNRREVKKLEREKQQWQRRKERCAESGSVHAEGRGQGHRWWERWKR